MKEILIEKLRSLLTRTEPRDLYDIHYILTNKIVDVEEIAFHAAPKFEAKGLVVGDLRRVLERRRATFQQLWVRRLNGQMPKIPDLDVVIRETNRVLQRYF
jgi:predicted nucleotidyltransferase component of viral defense system